MPRSIDFMISNPGHHWQMVRPVAERLARSGHDCRILSLCELRGFSPPSSEILNILPVVNRTGGGSRAIVKKTIPTGFVRKALRTVAWHATVGPRLDKLLRQRTPDVVVVPNDLSYPFDRCVELFRRRGTRFALLQEGILFRLPPSSLRPYGAGGAAAIAAWGEVSVSYFVDTAGAAPETVHATGSPRHDSFDRSQFLEESSRLRTELARDQKLIALFTTPVDKPGGHCSTEEKLASVLRFTDGLAPLAEKTPFRLVVKPHWGEDFPGYVEALKSSSIRQRLDIRSDLATFPLVMAADAVVVNGSTIGLEALLLEANVGVIPVPRTGYPFDFATSGVHVPIPAENGSEAVEELLGWSVSSDARNAYLTKHLANRPNAADRVAELLESI